MADELPPEPSTPPAAAGHEPREAGWERELVTRLAFAALTEQRRARRWGIAFKLAILAYLVALLVIYAPFGWLTETHLGRHTALVELNGVIGAKRDASARRIIEGLRAAFDDSSTAGVILQINSPGGSPVQAGYINDEIWRLRKLHPRVPIYAVITDLCASGGYYVAAAADRIYADKASVVGSIGVLMNGFGFVDAMHKLGVERRLFTAGAHKGFLDPFSPERPDEVAHVKSMLDQIHRQFIAVVKRGRGKRLAHDDSLFSGLMWTGEESVRLGLVDGLGSASKVARDIIGAPQIVDYTPRRSFIERVAGRVGAAAAVTLATQLSVNRITLR